MPTNLPPEYYEVERRYKAATTPADKVTCLEELISTIPKHKGTDHLRADLRRRLSKLRAAAQTKKKTSRRESAYQIDREGAGQAVLVGPTNVGKSALINALTSAAPEVSAAPYTTWSPTPGMMLVDHVQIQLVDTPPLNPDYVEPELMNLIRRADILLLVIDLQGDPFQQIEDSIALLREHRIVPLGSPDQTEEAHRVTSLPILVLVNKCDDENMDEDFEICCELVDLDWPLLPVSAETGRNLDRMKRTVFDHLEIIRIFSKAPGGEPDYTSPFVMPLGGTVEEFARKIHQDFYLNLKSARVWGSATFDGQLVGRDHVLHDGDVVELRI